MSGQAASRGAAASAGPHRHRNRRATLARRRRLRARSADGPDIPADKTAMPTVEPLAASSPHLSPNLRERVPNQLSRGLGAAVRVQSRAHGLLGLGQRVA